MKRKLTGEVRMKKAIETEDIVALGRSYANRDSVTVVDTKTQGRDEHGHFLKHVDALEPYKVYKSTDYDFFKRLRGNRHIHEKHVRELMISFKQHPRLLPAKPILLNEKQEIIDGQHREEGSRRLNLPVYYEVVPGLSIGDARILNALQGTWHMVDYAYSYSETDNPNYQQMTELMEKYRLSASVVFKMSLLSFKEDRTHNRWLDFKLGNYKPQPAKQTANYIKKLLDFREFFSKPNEYSRLRFAEAVIKLLQNPDYNHEKMLINLGRVGHINNWGVTEGYIRELETIYNYHSKSYTRIF